MNINNFCMIIYRTFLMCLFIVSKSGYIIIHVQTTCIVYKLYSTRKSMWCTSNIKYRSFSKTVIAIQSIQSLICTSMTNYIIYTVELVLFEYSYFEQISNLFVVICEQQSLLAEIWPGSELKSSSPETERHSTN